MHHPKKILDFGCGDGRLIHELCREKIAEVVGIDISQHARSFCQAISGHDCRVRIYETFKDIIDERFNAVIAMEVLEHISPHDLKFVLTDIHTVLDEAAVFVISVPTRNIPVNRKHYRHFTISEIDQEIDGLFVIDQTYFIHRIGTIANLLRRMIVNKFVIMNWDPWLNLTTFLYKRYVMKADAVNGAHLIAVLRKI
jgi:SAM-dependent methyltransferase